MKLDYKNWSVKDLGHIVIVSIILVVLITIMMLFVSPVLTTVLPMVFTTKLTLTEVLLFFVLVRLVVNK